MNVRFFQIVTGILFAFGALFFLWLIHAVAVELSQTTPEGVGEWFGRIVKGFNDATAK